mgnify:CR=1 FL=1
MKITGLSFWVGNEEEEIQNRCQASLPIWVSILLLIVIVIWVSMQSWIIIIYDLLVFCFDIKCHIRWTSLKFTFHEVSVNPILLGPGFLRQSDRALVASRPCFLNQVAQNQCLLQKFLVIQIGIQKCRFWHSPGAGRFSTVDTLNTRIVLSLSVEAIRKHWAYDICYDLGSIF